VPRGSNGQRPNQKQRTRKDLLEAAARLIGEGRRPSLEEVAEAALVSRATAYRYFPSVEALLLEVPVHVASPGAGVLDDAPAADPVARLCRVDEAFDAMIRANEAPLRLLLARILEGSVANAPSGDVPARQNRRSPLIEAALAPARESFAPEALERLTAALAILIGPESFLVTTDVLRLPADRAREVRGWAIEALVRAARRDP